MTTPPGPDEPTPPGQPSWLDKPTVPPGTTDEAPGYQQYEPYAQQPSVQQPYVQQPYAAPYGQPPYGQLAPGQQYGYAPSRGTNGLAIASLVCSLVWVCGAGSVAAVIMGHIARGQIRRSGEQGDGLAIAGLVIGYLGVVLLVAYIGLVGIGLALDPNAFD